MIPLVAPTSFDEPVKASQVRSKAQLVLDANRERVEKLYGSREAQRRLVRMLRDADAELSRRVAQWPSGGDRTWTQSDVEATLAQVRNVLAQVDPQMRRMLESNAELARRYGAEETTQILELFEGRAPGSIRPLSLGAASSISQATRLQQYATSVNRYGAVVIASVQRELTAGVLTGKTFDEMTRQLQTSEPLLSRRYFAERVVRTECMQAYNSAHIDEMRAQVDDFPDLKKKLIETFDRRTAKDSYTAHGEVRDLNGLFVDGAGRHYEHPPGRPNDRGVVIPWRDAWEEAPSKRRAASASPAAPAAPRVPEQTAIAAKVAPKPPAPAQVAPVASPMATRPTLDMAALQARGLAPAPWDREHVASTWARVFAGRVPTVEALEAIYSSPEHGVQATMRELKATEQGRALISFDLMRGKRKVGEGIRYFSRDEGGVMSVDHSWLVFEKSLQGKGIGRVIARQSMAAYAEMGAAKIELTAAMIGRYTWARLGYEWSAKHAEEKRRELTAFLTKKLGEKKAQEVLATTGKTAAEVSALTVGGKPLGKQFLLDRSTSTWHGSLPVKSPSRT